MEISAKSLGASQNVFRLLVYETHQTADAKCLSVFLSSMSDGDELEFL